MMIKKRIIFFSLVIAAVLIIFNGCSNDDEPFTNQKPSIELTSYGGDSLATVGDTTVFQQNIYWYAHDSNGWVESYAYRILNEDGVAIPTNSKEYFVGDLNGNGETDPDEGWIYHYEAGAQEILSLGDPNAPRTIWTDEVHTVVNFPAYGPQIFDPITNEAILDTTETGKVIYVYEPVVSIFEIKCIDDQGMESDIVRKYFKSESKAPSVLSISSSIGPIDKKVIGTGVNFRFSIEDTDPLIGSEPGYFLYKLEKRDLDGNVIPVSQDGYESEEWFSTEYQEDVTEVMLNPTTYPPLKANSIDPGDETAFTDSTYLTVIAYDLSGIPSKPLTISFAVKEGFYPGTMIYCGYNPLIDEPLPNYTFNDIFALGDYHYTKRKNDFIADIDIPEEVSLDGYSYGLPLWIDKDGNFTAINSPDLKIYMHWGYQGEYGKIGQSANTVTNSPYDQRIGEVLDENTQKLYFSELTYFDLQFDGEPYVYPPLQGLVETVEVDTFGFFTRIPIGADIDQRTILHGLDSGEHVFRVRAVDLSNIGDPTPAEFRFTLVDPVLKEEKEHKILIIDEDKDNSIFSPDALLDSLYLEYLADYTGTIDTYDLYEYSTSVAEVKTLNSLLHFTLDQFSPIDLQDYELVIYHNDQNNGSSKFHTNNDCLELFFLLGGNMVAALGDNLSTAYENCNASAYPLLEENFGIPVKRLTDDPILVDVVSNSYFTKPFLIAAAPENAEMPYINLETDTLDVWMNFILQKLGMGPCAFIEEDAFATVYDDPFFIPATPIYRYVCKEVLPDSLQTNIDPTQDDFDLFNDKAIALKHVNPIRNNTNYLFGFNLTVMDTEEVKALYNQILTELGIN